jgi:hypothetical protein
VSSISSDQAVQEALAIDNASGVSVTNSVFAETTVLGEERSDGISLPTTAVVGRDVWVITLTLDRPVSMEVGCVTPQTCHSMTVTENTLLIDPETGSMLFGFFS